MGHLGKRKNEHSYEVNTISLILPRTRTEGVQADQRLLPSNPIECWGFNGADVERLAVVAKSNVKWIETMAKIRASLEVKEAFEKYVKKSLQTESTVLQALLRQNDQTSPLLPRTLFSIMSDVVISAA